MRFHAYSNNKKVATAIVAVALVLSVGFFVLPVQQAHAVSPPTHQEILDAKTLMDAWFDDNVKSSVYETDASAESLFAEYQSIPLRFKDDDGAYISVGENVQNGFGLYTTKVYDATEIGFDTIQYRLQVCIPGIWVCDAPRILVKVDYDYPAGSGDTRITVKHEAWTANGKTADMDIYIGTNSIGTVSASTVGQTFTRDIVTNGDSNGNFRSHRYTERHVVQLAAMYADILDDATLQTELETALTNDGYTLEKDIYAPMFDQGTQFADNYLYESGASGVYRDCYISPSPDSWAYEYQSKVCTIGVPTYTDISKTQDNLVPMLWAIHLLNKGYAPDTDVSDGYRTWSARDVARWVEQNYWLEPIGVKSPAGSDTHASGVRTAAFLVLESVLAHRGDTTSDDYRDKAAAAVMQPRNEEGYVVREEEDGSSTSLWRPLHKGTWYTAWNGFNYVAKKSVLQQFSDLFNQIDEHPDIKPTNAETTILIMQALRTYDRFLYAGDTENVPE